MKGKNFVCLALVLFLLRIFPSADGQKVLYPQIRPSDARFENLEIDYGKAGMTVYSLLQDSKGFMWCSADAGLYRYDGSRFLKFSYGKNDTCLYGNIANTIYEDRKGTIWVGTHGALNRINNNKRIIDHFIPDSSDILSHDNSVRLIREDSEGMIWIMTDRNVFRLDTTESSFTQFPIDALPLRTLDVAIVDEEDKFVEDVKGFIWIATDKGLFRYGKRDQLWKKIFPSDTDAAKNVNPKINCIKADSAGNLWIGSESCGLLRIKDQVNGSYETIRKTVKSPDFNSGKPVTAILCLNENEVWFTEGPTVCKLAKDNLKCTEYIISDRFSTEVKWNSLIRMNKIIRGEGNDIWLLAYPRGILFKFNLLTEKVTYYQVPRYVVLASRKDNTGNLWFGCVANDIYILVTSGLPYRSGVFQNGSGVASEFRNIAAEDDEGNILIASWEGLYSLDNPLKTDMLIPEKSDFKAGDNFPSGIFRDSHNNLWICYSAGLIFKCETNGKPIKSYKLPGGPYSIQQAAAKIIREDKSGNLWFVTNDAGIFRLDKEKDEIRREFTNEDITGTKKFQTIMDFNIDRENNIWMSTLFGLYRIDQINRKIEDLTGFEGSELIFGNSYYRIIKDKNDRLWILCTMGSPYYYDFENKYFVCPYKKELIPVLSFIDMQIDNKGRIWLADNNIITVFDTISRIRTDYPVQMSGYVPISFVTGSGKVVYFIGHKLLIFPSEKSYNENIPAVKITGLTINNTDYHRKLDRWQSSVILREAVLKHDENNLIIEFAALNFVSPAMNKYRFIMQGVDRDTSYSEGLPVAEYRNMSPGKYKFWVTGSNNDGIWNKDGAIIDILIKPPWYKSLLAYLAYFILIAASVIAYIKFRIYTLVRDRENLEKEVRSRTEELEIKNIQLAETDRIKTQFFTDISHEIRTPLTLIKGPIDILSKTNEGNDKVTGMLASMKRNTDRLMQLVNELLDIVRLDAGKMKITLVEDDIIKNLRMLVYEFLSLAESREIKYIVEIPEAQCITWFDSYKVNIIITNLLSNAFRYTSRGGTVRCMIKIENNGPGQHLKYIKIIISDTGRGIGKEHIEKIFERFYRVEGHHESDGHGTGIGLSMVKEFVNLMHGEIKVDSTPGKGSIFAVTLPLGKEHLSASEFVITEKTVSEPYRQPAITRAELQMESLPDSRRAYLSKIMIIEDNPDLRNFITENLSDSYHLLEAENGKTGLGLAYSMVPDLIISDIMMPDLDGLQLCHKLKNDEKTSHIPIILLTAKATTEDKLTGLKSGADDYIIKPFNMDELKTRISNLLTIREKLKHKYLDPKSLERLDDSNKSVDDRLMERVIRLINENISNFDFDVALLHNLLGMSRMHLSRKLKALTGLSPHLLINRIRLEKAAELLRLNKGNVTEIANSVGISNPANFSRTFREHFGTSPKNYMNQFRNGGKNRP